MTQGKSRLRLTLAAALAVLVTACATQEGYRQRAALHIGQSSDALIVERGSPVERDFLSDGSEVWTYFVSEQRHDPGGYSTIPRERRIVWVDRDGIEHVRIEQYEETVYTPPRSWIVECETRFVISPDGVVRDFRFEGNACRAPEIG
ncbi:MAG: lipoprotein [Oceanicaulis sp. HLUCCA04]|nr:MAG: lipoprotein [Oceanicaulis sp. HLUCCA04]